MEHEAHEYSDPVRGIATTYPTSSRRDSLNEAFDDMSISGSMNNSNSCLSDYHHNMGQGNQPFGIRIPIPLKKQGQVKDFTKPVINNPFLDEFLRWPVTATDPKSAGAFPNQASKPPGNLPFQQNFNNFAGMHYNSDHNSSFDSHNDTKNASPDYNNTNETASPQMFSPQSLFSLPFLSLFGLSALQFNQQGMNLGPKFVGPLSFDERQERIRRYLEKKKNRKWKNIRYSVRKNLAEKRQRCQGRFVKSKVPFAFPPSAGNSNPQSSQSFDHMKLSTMSE